MSVETDVFVRGDCAVEDAVSFMEEAWALKFERVDESQGAVYRGSAVGVSIAIFGNHGLEDDGALLFSQYSFEVSFKRFQTAIDEDLSSQLCRTLAELFARHFCKRLGIECLVVEGLQRVVATVGDAHRSS
jgi:hypothetical protein